LLRQHNIKIVICNVSDKINKLINVNINIVVIRGAIMGRRLNRKLMYFIAFAMCIVAVNLGSMVISNADEDEMTVEYHACTVNGWNNWVTSGQECKVEGTDGMTRVEMHLKNDNGDSVDSSIEYSVASEAGWSIPVNGGDMASAAGKPIKAMNIKLVGDAANAYKVEYRACNSNGEWLAWANNGTVVGNINGDANLVGIEVKVVKTAQTVAPQDGVEGGNPDTVGSTPQPGTTQDKIDIISTPKAEQQPADGQQPVETIPGGAPSPTGAPGAEPEPEMIEYPPTNPPTYSDDDTANVENGGQPEQTTIEVEQGSVIINEDGTVQPIGEETIAPALDQTTEVIEQQQIDTGAPVVEQQPAEDTGAPVVENTTSDAAEALIAKAESQKGQGRDESGNTVYGNWWADRVSDSAFRDAKWCAMFLSWCANEAGVSEKTIGYFAACSYWEEWFKNNSKWQGKDGYTPVRGDILFINTDSDPEADHNGIVTSVSGTQVTTIEGNVNDKVDHVTYDINDGQILGYGKPDYANNTANVEQQQQEEQQKQESTGASGLAQSIIDKALSQKGTKERSDGWTKYGQWYNDNIDKGGFAKAQWCAMFVSWCADQVGVPRDVIKPYASCWYGLEDLKTRAEYHEASSGYEPKPGDIFFHKFRSDGSGHTGLVVKVEEGQIYTIEGNISNSVDTRTYPLSNSKMKGYITPRY